jgi:hypothetical protein
LAPSRLQDAVELFHDLLRRKSEKSLAEYLKHVVIDCLPEPVAFGTVVEPWQVARNARLVPAFEFVAGLNDGYAGPLNCYEGLSKGHDKSSYTARLLNWVAAFAPRQGLRCYVGARDGEQADILMDAMKKEAMLNPWFGPDAKEPRVDFSRRLCRGTRNGCEVHILTSDAGGSQGKNPDIVVCDELTVWDNRAFFESLQSGVAKRGDRTGRQRCLLLILTNAGYLGSWQDEIRQVAKEEDGNTWSYFEQPEGPPLASWISPSAVEANCRLLTPGEAKRLWANKWLNVNEDMVVFRSEDVDLCVGKPCPPPQSAKVILSVDYGEVRDRTALCTTWFDGDILHVYEVDCWQGSHRDPVQIRDVEEWLKRRLATYPNATVIIDKHQLVGTKQRLQSRGYDVREFQYRGGTQNFVMAENLRNLISNRKVRFSATAGLHQDGTTLATELKSVIRKDKSYGYRVSHTNDNHDDRVVVVGMAALEAVATTPPPVEVQRRRPPYEDAGLRRPVGGGFSVDHSRRRGLFGS